MSCGCTKCKIVKVVRKVIPKGLKTAAGKPFKLFKPKGK